MQIRSTSDTSSASKVCAPQALAANHTKFYLEGHSGLYVGLSTLDVGVFDRVHGWLQVSAALDAGGKVSASLNTANSAAQDSLRAAVPEMISYLTSEDVHISKLVVHRIPGELSTSPNADREARQGGNPPPHHQQREAPYRDEAATRSLLPGGQSAWSGRQGRGMNWINGITRVTAGLTIPFGVAARSVGNWVNVNA
jgi:hypothetical protein